jgi:hypothetical protein
MLRERSSAASVANKFMAKLRRYLRQQHNGTAIYSLICELMQMCAMTTISSAQLAAGLRSVMREHPKALNALNPLLARLHQLLNLVRPHSVIHSFSCDGMDGSIRVGRCASTSALCRQCNMRFLLTNFVLVQMPPEPVPAAPAAPTSHPQAKPAPSTPESHSTTSNPASANAEAQIIEPPPRPHSTGDALPYNYPIAQLEAAAAKRLAQEAASRQKATLAAAVVSRLLASLEATTPGVAPSQSFYQCQQKTKSYEFQATHVRRDEPHFGLHSTATDPIMLRQPLPAMSSVPSSTRRCERPALTDIYRASTDARQHAAEAQLMPAGLSARPTNKEQLTKTLTVMLSQIAPQPGLGLC